MSLQKRPLFPQFQNEEMLGFKHGIQLRRNQINCAPYSAPHVLFFTA